MNDRGMGGQAWMNERGMGGAHPGKEFTPIIHEGNGEEGSGGMEGGRRGGGPGEGGGEGGRRGRGREGGKRGREVKSGRTGSVLGGVHGASLSPGPWTLDPEP